MRVEEFRLLLRRIPKDFDIQVLDTGRGEWQSDLSEMVQFVKAVSIEDAAEE